jgi:hypothetical protein
MFSGPLEKIAISASVGILAGVIDSTGFFYTVKIFFAKTSGKKLAIAGALEIFRLIVLVTFIIFLCSHMHVLFLPLAIAALVFSLAGKMLFIFKGLKK